MNIDQNFGLCEDVNAKFINALKKFAKRIENLDEKENPNYNKLKVDLEECLEILMISHENSDSSIDATTTTRHATFECI